MLKIYLFLNWIFTVLLGSIINTAIVDPKFHLEIFLLFLSVSATLGVIPLFSMFAYQHKFDFKKLKLIDFKKHLIIIQFICYVIIFVAIMIVSNFLNQIGFAIFGIGLSYLIIGIALTLLLGITTSK